MRERLFSVVVFWVVVYRINRYQSTLYIYIYIYTRIGTSHIYVSNNIVAMDMLLCYIVAKLYKYSGYMFK